jgi:hypothetical protein
MQHIQFDHTYKKNWKTHNAVDVNKHKYVPNMNSKTVIVKNAFGSLKTRWHILKHFNLGVDRMQELLLIIVFFTTIGSMHGWGTQKDCLILYLLNPLI